MSRQKLYRILNSTWFSLLFMALLIGGLAAVAYYVTKSLQEEPDFGGMVTIRQSDMDIDPAGTGAIRLSKTMVLTYIAGESVLVPIARQYGWNAPYKDMVQTIDVKERLSAQNSYIILVSTGSAERSMKVARALAESFHSHYQKQWSRHSKQVLVACGEKIKCLNSELRGLKKLRTRLQNKNELRPLNTEVEMKALNEQLVEAQKQFLTAYGVYATSMEQKRSALQLELDLALQLHTESDTEIRNMRRNLAELTRQCEKIKKQLEAQKPDLYRMTIDPPKLTGLPNDILYFYDNIQTLQQIKLALMIGSIIEEKEKMLDREQKKKNSIERLLESNSCDVFIREVNR